MFEAHNYYRVASIFQWFCIKFVGIPSPLSLTFSVTVFGSSYFVVLSQGRRRAREKKGNSLNLTAYNQALANGNVLFCCRQNRCDRVIATRSIHNKTLCSAVSVAVAVPSFCIWCTCTFSIYWNRTKELMRGKERQETKQTERTNIKCDVDAETLNWIEFLHRKKSS